MPQPRGRGRRGQRWWWTAARPSKFRGWGF